MPRNKKIKKVLVIGSGPIIIGQAAEFDYAGTQACRALKAEGVEVVLINSNPATIMTDPEIADHVYIEPLTVECVKKVIKKEHVDSILPTLGGQVGLNITMALEEEGFLKRHHVRVIGTATAAIRKAEDREQFKHLMEQIHEPVAASTIVTHLEEAKQYAQKIGYPVVVRPAYTLGGSGGGIVDNEDELEEICAQGLRLSRVSQCLIEKSIEGWKEIEYEVMRDHAGNCITVCNMENIDPIGVHTGDSIVVAPSQTLSDKEYQMLRSSAFHIIQSLEIEGGCNVQFALNSKSFEYCIIEVNPRVSRSSALASKATGYPIAKLAAKIALGYTLDEIRNDVTGKTYAFFEPVLDYIVCKIPKWPFDKFHDASRQLGTQMKATGEVMAICDNFEGALLKALRSLESNQRDLYDESLTHLTVKQLRDLLECANDQRLYVIAEALRMGVSVQEIHERTRIDIWFIWKIHHIIEIETQLQAQLTPQLLEKAKRYGFSDGMIARMCPYTQEDIRSLRERLDIHARYKAVDTCAAEFDAVTPYFYSTYQGEQEYEDNVSQKKILVLGSGPIRIGQGIEFDFCSVHCVLALKEEGYQTIIINNNPETVSTDFDIADRLYFEPLVEEEVEEVIRLEKPEGVIVQFGGQTAIKLTQYLRKRGVPILGTSADDIDVAEDRKRFDQILEKCHIQRPLGDTVMNAEEALKAAQRIGYPVLIRPSYVLGGAGMEIALNDQDIMRFMGALTDEHKQHPVLIDQYLAGKECEVDAVCDGTGILIPGIMEHVERAGVHSGDSISIYPPQKISADIQAIIVNYTHRLAQALHVRGLINIQFIVYENHVYVIEVNPRSSRTIPYISKVTGVPIVKLATRVIMGETLPSLGYDYGLKENQDIVAVKMPVFSFEKIKGADIALGPEMKSTGEVLGLSTHASQAIYKAFLGTGVKMPETKKVIVTIKESDKPEFLSLADKLYKRGYQFYATTGTCRYLNDHHIPCEEVASGGQGPHTILALMMTGTIDFVVDIPSRHGNLTDGFMIRRQAVETGIPIYTSLDTANAFIDCISEEGQTLDLIDIADLKAK